MSLAIGLTQVSVTGHRYTPDSDILDAVGLDDARTMLSFDSRAAQDRIERLPWMERASIERDTARPARGARDRASHRSRFGDVATRIF